MASIIDTIFTAGEKLFGLHGELTGACQAQK